VIVAAVIASFALMRPSEIDEQQQSHFSSDSSTSEQHRASNATDAEFLPEFRASRLMCDYSYHDRYSQERQGLQDAILRRVLSAGTVHTNPLLVFTAGAMGAGKSHVLAMMHRMYYGAFNLSRFNILDPDQIRFMFPEMQQYLQANPIQAGVLTHLEASYVVELGLYETLRRRNCAVIDGSLQDWQWHAALFKRIRASYPHYRLAILHVTANRTVVHDRAIRRAKKTGRVVPPQLLDSVMDKVPVSVRALTPVVDFVVEVDNTGDVPCLVNWTSSDSAAGPMDSLTPQPWLAWTRDACLHPDAGSHGKPKLTSKL